MEFGHWLVVIVCVALCWRALRWLWNSFLSGCNTHFRPTTFRTPPLANARAESQQQLAPAAPRSRDPTGAPAWIDDLPRRFVVIDVETTGLDATRHQITQIAARRISSFSFDAGKFQCTYDEFNSYCLLRPRTRIPKHIQELTGITPALLKSHGQPLEVAIRDFVAFVGGDTVVAHNAPFDLSFLTEAAAGCGIAFAPPSRCTLAMARSRLPGRRSYSLSALCAAMGLETTGAHDARRDVELALSLFVTLSALPER